MRHKNYNLIASWNFPLNKNSEFRGELLMLGDNSFEFVVMFRYGKEIHAYTLDLNCKRDEAMKICSDMVSPLLESPKEEEEEEEEEEIRTLQNGCGVLCLLTS